MPQHNLTQTLQELVQHHGISSVLHSLADIQASPQRSKSSSSLKRSRARKARSKASAVDYVGKMTLPPEKAEVMARAAQRFEDKGFLPSIADIREFCRIYGVEMGKSASRASSIPRIFKFLAAIDTAQIAKVLDEGAFSGPARLAPIADAIRNHSAGRLRARRPDLAQPVSDMGISDRTKDR